MNKLSPSRLEAYRKAVNEDPEGCEQALLDHIDAITAEYAERVTELQQQMIMMSDDLLNISNKWRDHNDLLGLRQSS